MVQNIACKDADPNLFFGSHQQSAVKLCRKCDVIDACYQAIQDVEDKFGRQEGVWAGLTKTDRENLWTVPDHLNQSYLPSLEPL